MFGDKIKSFAKEKFGSDKLLAEALGMSPQQLAAYTAEKRKPGFEILQKLGGLGCDIPWLLDNDKTISELNNSFNPVKVTDEKKGCFDILGAIELSNTPAPRLAQLMGVSPATLDTWRTGASTPTLEQLVNLFNLTVALGLSARHAPPKPLDTAETTDEPTAPMPPSQATA